MALMLRLCVRNLNTKCDEPLALFREAAYRDSTWSPDNPGRGATIWANLIRNQRPLIQLPADRNTHTKYKRHHKNRDV